jgi:hypothetical protein
MYVVHIPRLSRRGRGPPTSSKLANTLVSVNDAEVEGILFLLCHVPGHTGSPRNAEYTTSYTSKIE